MGFPYTASSVPVFPATYLTSLRVRCGSQARSRYGSRTTTEKICAPLEGRGVRHREHHASQAKSHTAAPPRKHVVDRRGGQSLTPSKDKEVQPIHVEIRRLPGGARTLDGNRWLGTNLFQRQGHFQPCTSTERDDADTSSDRHHQSDGQPGVHLAAVGQSGLAPESHGCPFISRPHAGCRRLHQTRNPLGSLPRPLEWDPSSKRVRCPAPNPNAECVPLGAPKCHGQFQGARRAMCPSAATVSATPRPLPYSRRRCPQGDIKPEAARPTSTITANLFALPGTQALPGRNTTKKWTGLCQPRG